MQEQEKWEELDKCRNKNRIGRNLMNAETRVEVGGT
jgi:hypothetical protein